MNNTFLGLLAVCFVCLQGCVPVFSSFQSARILEEGQAEFTPAYSSVYFLERDSFDESELQHAQHVLGLRFASGTSEVSEFQISYARLLQGEKEFGINVFGLGWKRSLIKDKMAFVLPVGTAIGSNVGGLFISTHPSVVLTIPAGLHLDINPSFTGVFPINRAYNKGVAFNIGAAIKPLNKNWDLRPEFGVLKFFNDRDLFLSAGVGLSLKFKSK